MGSVLSLAAGGLGACGTCLGSIAGSCAASLACKACSCACAVSKRTSSILYIGILSVFVIMALSFRYGGGDIVIGGSYNQTEAKDLVTQMKDYAKGQAVSSGKDWWNKRFGCASAHPDGWIICCANTCSGVFSVYRFSFALCLFFASLALLTAGKSRIGALAHRGFWIAKAFVLVGLLASTLFISNETLVGYREAARYLSFGFLLMQILLLIDFGYTWNETWLSWDEASDNDGICGWRLAIVLAAGSLYALSLTGWVLLYVYFGGPGCPAQQTLISITLLLSLALTAISCSKIAPHGTLLTSAVVSAYCTFLCFSALASWPSALEPKCNPMAATDHSSWDLLVGLLVAAVSMASTAFSATSSKEALVGRSEASSASSAMAEMGKPLDETANSSSAEAEESTEPESWWYYHVMMATCALYMSMLLTDWSWAPADPTAPEESNLSSFWVKIASQWVCLLVYGWTLLAPYLLREYRDFGIEFDFD